MKKFTVALVAIAIAAFVATSASAEEKYVAGGFEASGHVIAGAGYEHFTSKTLAPLAGGYFVFDGDVGYFAGPIGKYLGTPPAGKSDHFTFFVDEVELDLMKSFGENIRLRADLDFARTNSAGLGVPAFVLEQAYATANIPIGNGLEVMFGRFNTPIGFESVDVNENDTISKSVLVTALRPANTTGLKLYYSFSDLVDLHFYIVNKAIQDTNIKVGDVPSIGFRLGFNWGEEGSESTFGFSGIAGPEYPNSRRHWMYLGDVDLNWWITESFALGLEGLFSRFNANAPGFNNVHYAAGLLNLHYAFSDVWDGTLKYAFAKQFKTASSEFATPLPGNLTGIEQSLHQISLAGGYGIADGAKLKLEGRFDIINPVGPSNTYYSYGGALAFAYNF